MSPRRQIGVMVLVFLIAAVAGLTFNSFPLSTTSYAGTEESAMGKSKFAKYEVPSHIYLKKHTYRVVYIKEFEKQDQMGETDYRTFTVTIKMGLSKEDEIKTYYHELCHILSYEYGAFIPHSSIYLLEDAIYDFVRLNL